MEEWLKEIRKVALFNWCSEEFLKRMHPLLVSLWARSGDTIVNQGDIGQSMYFLKVGSVTIHRDGEVVSELQAPSFFGEISVLMELTRTASVRASSDSLLYIFKKADMVKTNSHYFQIPSFLNSHHFLISI